MYEEELDRNKELVSGCCGAQVGDDACVCDCTCNRSASSRARRIGWRASKRGCRLVIYDAYCAVSYSAQKSEAERDANARKRAHFPLYVYRYFPIFPFVGTSLSRLPAFGCFVWDAGCSYVHVNHKRRDNG